MNLLQYKDIYSQEKDKAYLNTPTVRVISEIKENKTNVCFPNAFKNKEREEFSAFSKS